jgi:hypothetical protein
LEQAIFAHVIGEKLDKKQLANEANGTPTPSSSKLETTLSPKKSKAKPAVVKEKTKASSKAQGKGKGKGKCDGRSLFSDSQANNLHLQSNTKRKVANGLEGLSDEEVVKKKLKHSV